MLNAEGLKQNAQCIKQKAEFTGIGRSALSITYLALSIFVSSNQIFTHGSCFTESIQRIFFQ